LRGRKELQLASSASSENRGLPAVLKDRESDFIHHSLHRNMRHAWGGKLSSDYPISKIGKANLTALTAFPYKGL